MDKMRVLIIDDEENICKVLAAISADEGYEPSTCGSVEEARVILSSNKFQLCFLDVWLPGIDGMAFLQELGPEKLEALPVVMISGHGTIDMAVQAVKHGAWDFIEKPLSLDRISAVLRHTRDIWNLRTENLSLRGQVAGEDPIVGTSVQVDGLRHLIGQAASSNASVFIAGENGTGKELVARHIHRQSNRAKQPFIAVNCAAIPDTLIESELFGHEKGAFTGANVRRKGRFELADKGTLFLDEVLDLSAAAQAKLLRVLQEMRIERLGSESSISVDVRIVAASNRDVRTEVQAGRFREDLFYRLHVLPIDVPPLRDRRQDIASLCGHFLANETDAQARSIPEISPQALQTLQNFDWPGNIRQLKNIIQRLLVICDLNIEQSDVERALGQDKLLNSSESQNDTAALWQEVMTLDLQEAKDAFERRFLLLKLEEHGYNITRTAQNLGMYPSNLHAKIRKYRLER